MFSKIKKFISGIKGNDVLTVRGDIKVELHYNDGRIVTHCDEKNIVVLTAKQALLSYIYTSGQTSDPINSLHVGTGGSIDPQGYYPKPVSQNMTQLYNELTQIPTTYSIDNTVPSVTFIADVDQGTAIGAQINEAGLFKTSGLMFNIKTFPAINKTAEFSVHFEWTIKLA